MAKVYESIEDMRRDDLKQTIHDAKSNASTAASLGVSSALIGLLNHRLDRAEKAGYTAKPTIILNMEKPAWLEKLQKSSAYKSYEKFSEKHLNKAVTIACGALVAMEGLVYLISKREQKKAQAELNCLGPGQEIIHLGNGAKVELPQDAEATRQFLQDAPVIMQQLNRIQPKPTVNTAEAELTSPQQAAQQVG